MAEFRGQACVYRSFVLKDHTLKRALLDYTSCELLGERPPPGTLETLTPAHIDALIEEVRLSAMDTAHRGWIVRELNEARRCGDRVVVVRRRFREPPLVGQRFAVDLIARGKPGDEAIFAAVVTP